MRTWIAPTTVVLALLLAGCGDAPEADLDGYDAIEAPDREPPRETPRTGSPARTADFQGVGGADVTGQVRLYDMRVSGAAGPRAAEPGGTASGGGGGASLGFRVEVTLDGLEPGEHDWHIHDGPCGESAAVAVAMTDLGDMAGIARPLTARPGDEPARGAAMVRSLTLSDLDESGYSLRVHASSGEGGPGPVVACADLSGSGPAEAPDAAGTGGEAEIGASAS